MNDHSLVVFSPGIGADEVSTVFWQGYRWCATWPAVVSELNPHLNESPMIGILPCAPLQVAAGRREGGRQTLCEDA